MKFAFLRRGIKKKGFGCILDVPTDLTVQEKYLLYRKANNLKPNSVIVEIGSYLGASSCFLALGAMNNGSTVYCVDTWKNQAMSEGERDTYENFLENTKLFPNIVPLRGYSGDIGRTFDRQIDLLFVDGDHSYGGVKIDVQTWSPFLKNESVIIFHDIGWAEGVAKVIDELIKPMAFKEGCLPNLYWSVVRK